MFKNLLPDLYVENINSINYEKLKSAGIENLIFDIDNTLSDYTAVTAEKSVTELFETLKAADFNICLASNNREQRVKNYAASLSVPYISSAFKPSKRGFRQSLKILNGTYDKTAVIGDQIFTDIWGGNRLKMYTILVNPISDKDLPFVKLKRKLERFIIRKIKPLQQKQDA